MLGLGIGAFTSVFAVANAVLFPSNGSVRVPVETSHKIGIAESDQRFDGELSRLEKRVFVVVFGSNRLAAVELHSVWRRCEQSRAGTCGGDFAGSVLCDGGGTPCGTNA
jgi:hypothetical protein